VVNLGLRPGTQLALDPLSKLVPAKNISNSNQNGETPERSCVCENEDQAGEKVVGHISPAVPETNGERRRGGLKDGAGIRGKTATASGGGPEKEAKGGHGGLLGSKNQNTGRSSLDKIEGGERTERGKHGWDGIKRKKKKKKGGVALAPFGRKNKTHVGGGLRQKDPQYVARGGSSKGNPESQLQKTSKKKKSGGKKRSSRPCLWEGSVCHKKGRTSGGKKRGGEGTISYRKRGRLHFKRLDRASARFLSQMTKVGGKNMTARGVSGGG